MLPEPSLVRWDHQSVRWRLQATFVSNIAVESNKRIPTREQAWKPCTYIQYNTIKGSRCPRCIDGAVGSTPTYAPTRFSINSRSRSSRSLVVCYNRLVFYIRDAMDNSPYYLIDIAPFLQHGQHALFPPSLDLCGLTCPF